MKHLFAIWFILFGAFTSFAQTDTTAVPFVSYWAKGDSYDFKITKIKQQWRGEEQTKNDTSSYVANFLVLDSTATTYKIKWSYETGLAENYNLPQDMLEKLSEYQQIDVIYITSELGEFVEIENWEEISKMMTSLFDELIDIYSKNGEVEKEKFTKVMQPMITMYQSKEGIELMAYKELQLFHFPMGVEFTVGDTIKYEDELPNMFGGPPIKAPTKLYLDEVDFDDSYCSLIQEMTLDPKDTQKMIISFFKKMGIKDKEVKKMLKESEINVSDYNTYNFYFYPGVPDFIEATRTTLMNINNTKAVRVDITQIELL